MKKSVKIIGLCLSAILIVVGIYAALPPKTLDFRGTVTEIENADGNTVFHLSANKAAYTVVANNKTDIAYCCKDDPAIDLSEIKVGDTVEGNYRRFSKENIAKFITVEYHNR